MPSTCLTRSSSTVLSGSATRRMQVAKARPARQWPGRLTGDRTSRAQTGKPAGGGGWRSRFFPQKTGSPHGLRNEIQLLHEAAQGHLSLCLLRSSSISRCLSHDIDLDESTCVDLSTLPPSCCTFVAYPWDSRHQLCCFSTAPPMGSRQPGKTKRKAASLLLPNARLPVTSITERADAPPIPLLWGIAMGEINMALSFR